MGGTRSGGLKAAAKVKERFGKDFYAVQGAKGGRISRGGYATMPREKVIAAGRKGGTISRRGPAK